MMNFDFERKVENIGMVALEAHKYTEPSTHWLGGLDWDELGRDIEERWYKGERLFDILNELIHERVHINKRNFKRRKVLTNVKEYVIKDVLYLINYIVMLEENFLHDVLWDEESKRKSFDMDDLEYPIGCLNDKYERYLTKQFFAVGLTIREAIEWELERERVDEIIQIYIDLTIERTLERVEEIINEYKLEDNFEDGFIEYARDYGERKESFNDEKLIDYASLMKFNCMKTSRRRGIKRFTKKRLREEFLKYSGKDEKMFEEYIEMLTIVCLNEVFLIYTGFNIDKMFFEFRDERRMLNV